MQKLNQTGKHCTGDSNFKTLVWNYFPWIWKSDTRVLFEFRGFFCFFFVYPSSCFHIHAELPQKIGNIQNKNIIKRSLPKRISSSQTPYMIFIDLMRKRCQLINVDVDVCTVYVSSNCLCDKVITVQPYK